MAGGSVNQKLNSIHNLSSFSAIPAPLREPNDFSRRGAEIAEIVWRQVSAYGYSHNEI
jgi:hypothetical protein